MAVIGCHVLYIPFVEQRIDRCVNRARIGIAESNESILVVIVKRLRRNTVGEVPSYPLAAARPMVAAETVGRE